MPNYVLVERPSSEETAVYAAEKLSPKGRVPIQAEDVVMAPQWSAAHHVELLDLLNRYRDAFAKNIHELGCIDVLKMDIVVAPGSEPVNIRPYRTSPSDRQLITEILDEWKAAGIISDSSPPYASPVLLVSKSTGDKRFCVDYRRLNANA